MSAVLQLALPTLLAAADARLVAESAGQRAHAERSSGPACHAPHSDECVVCQALSTLGAPTRGATAVVGWQAPCQPTIASPTPRMAVAAATAPARAPPAA